MGIMIGKFIGDSIIDNDAFVWGFSLTVGIICYTIPSFIKYTRFTPQQLLSFHGNNSPLSRSTSREELRVFFGQLHEGGLIINFYPERQTFIVNISQWKNLTDEEKAVFLHIAKQAVSLEISRLNNGESSQKTEIKIFDQHNELLKSYI
jgi:hypothetical protein